MHCTDSISVWQKFSTNKLPFQTLKTSNSELAVLISKLDYSSLQKVINFEYSLTKPFILRDREVSTGYG